MFTSVIEAPSPETLKLIAPLLALSPTSIAPLKNAPGVSVGIGGSEAGVAAGAPHPTKNTITNVATTTCCNNLRRLIFPSFRDGYEPAAQRSTPAAERGEQDSFTNQSIGWLLAHAYPREGGRLQPSGAIRSLEIVPSNGAKDERQGRAVIDRMNLDN